MSAFEDCRSLEEVHLPDNIRVLEDAFRGCIYQRAKNATKMVVKLALCKDGEVDAAIWSEVDRHFVEEVELEEGITKIAEGTFKACERLVSVKFPSTLDTIGKEAFAQCVALKELH